MTTRYSRKFAEEWLIENKLCNIYECPECGFMFDSLHEVDDEEGGYECPECREDELLDGIKDVLKLMESRCGIYDNPRTMTLDEIYNVYEKLKKIGGIMYE